MKEAREKKMISVRNGEIDLIELIRKIYSGRKVVAILTILGIFVGGGLGYFSDRNKKKKLIQHL